MAVRSLWQETGGIAPACPAGRETVYTEVAVIGGGLCGLLCAHELAARGHQVVLLERDTLGAAITAHTTAKVTAQHGLIYDRLTSGLGEAAATQYASAQAAAVQRLGEIVRARNIACDWTATDAWLYATTATDADTLAKEGAAACAAGLPMQLELPTELPLPVMQGLRLPGQARFHPLKFLYGLAEQLLAEGVKIFTHTPALADDAAMAALQRGELYIPGGRVCAEHIVLATHFPYIDAPGRYFLRLYQHRSYVLALRGAGPLSGVYLDAAENGLSFRMQGEYLLLGGQSHKTGHEGDTAHYAELSRQAAQLYPRATVAAHWSAQDCMTHDGAPYIGAYPQLGERVWVATGFNKWGMSNSMAAAMVLATLIDGEQPEAAAVFSPQRSALGAQAASLIAEGADTAVQYTRRVTDPKAPVCTHMGCALCWNEDERSWDCPCHGSRFAPAGEVLHGPAHQPLDNTDGE